MIVKGKPLRCGLLPHDERLFPATAMPDADWWQVLWPEPGKVLAEMGVQRGMIVIDLCCGDGRFTAPLARVADHVFAVDIDAAVLDQARVRLAEAGMTNCEFIMADAMKLDAVVSEPVANTFHGVPDQLGLARVVAAKLKPQGQFGIVNWHRRSREETVVLGQPRGPKTEMRIEVDEVTAIVELAGLLLNRSIELLPHHYGVVLGRRRE